MVVEYATWITESDEPVADERYLELLAACRAEPGCLAYDLRIDPTDPRRRSLFQAWESPEAFQAHLVSPAHDQMANRDSPSPARDVQLMRWSDAEGFERLTYGGEE
jgi:quinol monooxygenase YgiN